MEFLDLETQLWQPRTALPVDDLHWGASLPYQDSFIIAGGFTFDLSEYLPTFYYFNPEIDGFEEIGSRMVDGRERFPAFMVPDSYAMCV